MTADDLDAYFQRIGYAGPRQPTLPVLRDLHRLHPLAIPFENLDTLTGVTPGIDMVALRAKLIDGGRGGYCFEHNGLLLDVLQSLGFSAVGLAARGQWGVAADHINARTHMLIRVDLPEGSFLADVGYGGIVLTEPLALELEREQETSHGRFRLVRLSEHELQMQFETQDGFLPLYAFALTPQSPIDYAMANWYIATSPDSRFVSNLICARVLPDRRIGLLNNALSVRWIDGRVDKAELDFAGLKRVLIEDFGLPALAVENAEHGLAKVIGG